MIKIDGYAIDAALSEEHSYEADVTEFPVEKGANITDHVRIKPRMYRLEGIVSDTPLAPLTGIRADANRKPTEEARAVLVGVFEGRLPVTIEAALTIYTDMVMESLTFPQDGATGDALPFSASFRQVIIQENRRVLVRVAKPNGSKKRNLGNIAARPPGWIGTDATGHSVVVTNPAPGVDVYTRADGTQISPDEAAAAARRNDSVLISYDKNGHSTGPVDPTDYQPTTPKQKKPYWAPKAPVSTLRGHS